MANRESSRSPLTKKGGGFMKKIIAIVLLAVIMFLYSLPAFGGQTPTGNTITIGTPQGSVIMKNFYKTAAIVSPGSGALIVDNPAYDISYYTGDSSFIISLKQPLTMPTRAAASEAFIQVLGISEQDACKLKVILGVPISVDPHYAGRDLGLSFCGIPTR